MSNIGLENAHKKTYTQNLKNKTKKKNKKKRTRMFMQQSLQS